MAVDNFLAVLSGRSIVSELEGLAPSFSFVQNLILNKSVRLLVSINYMKHTYHAFAKDLGAVAMVYSTSATLFIWSVVATAYPIAG